MKAKNLIAWICFPVISLSVLMSAYHWNNGVEPTRISSVLYSSLSRTVWCTGIAWIAYNCCIGTGGSYHWYRNMNILIASIKSISLLLGIVGRILSHPVFVPLSRLSFGLYLSQLVVIYIIFFTRKSVTDWTHFDFVRKMRSIEKSCTNFWYFVLVIQRNHYNYLK